jgi:hypothetical protein
MPESVNSGKTNYCATCEALTRENVRLREIVGVIKDCLQMTDERPATLAKDYATVHGKMIARAATLAGRKLSDVSLSVGFAEDYAARVCRGDLKLNRRAALLIGQFLDIDLLPYVERDHRGLVPAVTVSLPFEAA